MITRRDFAQWGAATAVVSQMAGTAFAQSSQPVRIVNGFPAGGVVDAVSRKFGDAMVASGYATAAVVENRTGAGGRLAAAFVKAAPADGNTLLLSPDTVLSLYPFIYAKLEYDPFKDLVPISTAALTSDALAVGPLVPDSVRNVRDFVAWAKAHPEHANFGSPGTGSPLHLLGSLLGKEGDFDFRHVAYRGASPGVTDMVGGQIAAMAAPTGNFLPFQRTGRVRILGTSGVKRSPFTPDTPTFSEQKFAGDYPQEDQWFGFFAPAGTAAASIAKANQSISQAMSRKSLIDDLAVFGLTAQASTPEAMSASLRLQHEIWRGIVKRLGFTAES